MKVCHTCQRSYPAHFANCPQDGALLLQSHEWSTGTVIRGKYRILEKLGQGAMGAVYKAVHLHFDEIRAVKVMSGELTKDKTFLKRFQHEAIMARKLNHPNAVRVEDIDETEDGQPFIVMEYIAGRSLRSLIESNGPLPLSRVAPIIKDIASALNAAHLLGIVHRDIKPDNIILIGTKDGDSAKVLDFGVAKMSAGLTGTKGGSLTESGAVVGTPLYMSPEQAKGIPSEKLDGRSDLYSLGVVMYQMLTGELPLKGETPVQIVLAHISEPPIPIRHARPDLQIPDRIAALVMKCLEKSPDRRPADGNAIIRELEGGQLTDALPVVEPPQSVRTVLYAATEKNELPPSADKTEIDPQPLPSPIPTPPNPEPVHSAARGSDHLAESFAGFPTLTAAAQPPPTSPVPTPPRPDPVRSESPLSENIAASVPGFPTQSPTPKPLFASAATRKVAESLAKPPTFRAVLRQKPSQDATRTRFLWGTLGLLLLAFLATAWYMSTVPIAAHKEGPVQATPAASDSGSSGVGSPRVPQEPLASTVNSEAAGSNVDGWTKKVNAAKALGDLYYERGDYNTAIKEYRKILDLAPGNKVLQERVQRARKAKAMQKHGNP